MCDEEHDIKQFDVVSPSDFHTSEKYSRPFLLTISFIYGMLIENVKPLNVNMWKERLQDAEEKRLDVTEVKAKQWNELRVIINWWHKKYHNPAKPINKVKYKSFLQESIKLWRYGL